MRIIGFLILMILSGCNSELAQLSPISNIANGLFISPITSQYTDINTSISISFQITDSENLLDCTTSVSVTSDNTILFPDAGITLSGSAPNCLLTVTPDGGFSGLANFQVLVGNGVETAFTNFLMTVSAQLPPTVVDVGVPILLNEDTPQTFNLSYSDSNGDKATSCTTSSPTNASIVSTCSCDASGVCGVTIQGNPDVFGLGQFSFQVMDDDGWSNTATINYDIRPVNDLPSVSGLSATVNGSIDQLININFQIGDKEDSLSCSSTYLSMTSSNQTLISNSSVTWSGTVPNCTATLSPGAGEVGQTIVTFKVTDDDSGETVASFNYQINSARLVWRNSSDTVNVASYSFGTPNANTAITLLVKNTGNVVSGPVTITDLAFSNRIQHTGTCPLLAPQATCSITINWSDTNPPGLKNETFTASDGSVFSNLSVSGTK